MVYDCLIVEYIGTTPVDDEGVSWNQYKDSNGAIYRFNELPIGAMFVNVDCKTHSCKGKERGGCLYVKIPQRADGEGGGMFWQPDHPTLDNVYWLRSGSPPFVTATPSILNTFAGGYHGWLRDGKLVDA